MKLVASVVLCAVAGVQAQRINEIVVLGSHNSYHVASPAPILPEWRYEHPALATQAEMYNVRHFELDLYSYTPPAVPVPGPDVPAPGPDVPEPLAQGTDDFQIAHILEFDEMSNCPTLRNCSQELQAWSAANPTHIPLFIYINIKAGPDNDGWAAYNRILDEVWDDNLYTPAELQGDFASLREAVIDNGAWPLVDDVRGQVFYLVDSANYLTAVTEDRNSFVQLSIDTADTDPDVVFLNPDVIEDDDAAAQVADRAMRGWILHARTDTPDDFLFPVPSDDEWRETYFTTFDRDNNSLVSADETLAFVEATGFALTDLVTNTVTSIISDCGSANVSGVPAFTRAEISCIQSRASFAGFALPPRASSFLTPDEAAERRDLTFASGAHLIGTDHFIPGEETSGGYVVSLADGCEFYLNPWGGSSCGDQPADIPEACTVLCIASMAPTEPENTESGAMQLASTAALWIALPLALAAMSFQ